MESKTLSEFGLPRPPKPTCDVCLEYQHKYSCDSCKNKVCSFCVKSYDESTLCKDCYKDTMDNAC